MTVESALNVEADDVDDDEDDEDEEIVRCCTILIECRNNGGLVFD